MPTGLLLIEAGGTKTDWCFLQKNVQPLQFKTRGFNPNSEPPQQFNKAFSQAINEIVGKGFEPAQVVYYGAGCSSLSRQEQIRSNFLQSKLPQIAVHSDLLAAARSLMGQKQGLLLLLGTGSNAAYYDGYTLKAFAPNLGFVLGDEGSGAAIGKALLRHYLLGTAFQDLGRFVPRKSKQELVSFFYGLENQQAFLAHLVRKYKESGQEETAFVELVVTQLDLFFQHYLLPTLRSWSSKVYAAGSIAAEFPKELDARAKAYNFELRGISKNLLPGLIAYHEKEL